MSVHFYFTDDRMLSPSWFGDDRVAAIDARIRFLNNDFAPGQDVPPPGTKMVKMWRQFPGEAQLKPCAVMLEEFEENERRERAAQDAAIATERERRTLEEAARTQRAEGFQLEPRDPGAVGSGLQSVGERLLPQPRLRSAQQRRRPRPAARRPAARAHQAQGGDLLCEASPEWVNDYYGKKIYPVTCKVCLRIADRWKEAS